MKLKYTNIRPIVDDAVHGWHVKDLAVLHETVSPDIRGLADILGNAKFLGEKGYGINGLTDAEGNAAWAVGLGNAIFYQAGGVNTRSVGIEQVSKIMLQSPSNVIRSKLWAARQPQLRATAKLLACWHNTDKKNHPLVYSDGTAPGVTTHWDVSQHFPQSEGHTDCWPKHKGGYYDVLGVIRLARAYALTGLTF